MTTTTATLVSAPVQEPQTEVPEVIEVVVSLKHIQEGEPYKGGRCAVALALLEQGFEGAMVDYGEVSVGCTSYTASPDLHDWLCAFDKDKSSVAPERFKLVRAA